MKRIIGCFALMLVASVATAFAQAGNAGAIVSQFYPQSYVNNAAALGEQIKQVSCYAVYQTAANGTAQTIVAGYSDGANGTVQVLTQQGPGNYAIAFEPSGLDLGGDNCDAELIDVDGDGVNEIHISFAAQADGSDWVFKWNGTTLTSIGPVIARRGRLGSAAFNSAFLDLYHDGTLQMLSGGDPDNGIPNVVYRLVNGVFVQDSPVLCCVDDFVRNTGAPQTQSAAFNLVQGSTGPYTLMVINGDRGGANRVSSGRITLNGTDLVLPNQFNQQVETISAPIPLLNTGQNVFSVQLDGPPGSHLRVLVKDQTPGFVSH